MTLHNAGSSAGFNITMKREGEKRKKKRKRSFYLFIFIIILLVTDVLHTLTYITYKIA